MGDTTPTVIDNFFTEEQIAYLTTLPETIKANADLLPYFYLTPPEKNPPRSFSSTTIN